jgi:hypothetical protein
VITTADLETATKGRLAAADPETDRLLEVGLGIAQRYCGWHVTPERDHDIAVIDGDVRGGGLSLRLPTLRIGELYTVTEAGLELDLAELDWSTTGRLYKLGGGLWSTRPGAIVVDMRHGFDIAPAFESAVISYIARTSMSTAEGGRQRTAVGPFAYGVATLEEGSAFTAEECFALDLYKLEAYP